MYPVQGYTISNHFGVKNDRYKAGYHTGIDIKVIPSLAFASTVIPVTEELAIAPEVNTPLVILALS